MKIRLINGNPSTVKKTRLNKKDVLLMMILHQLSNFMILILILWLSSRFLGGITDTVIILIIVIVNAVMVLYKNTELKKAVEALKM
jgi:Ca2+-transporting ATPase